MCALQKATSGTPLALAKAEYDLFLKLADCLRGFVWPALCQARLPSGIQEVLEQALTIFNLVFDIISQAEVDIAFCVRLEKVVGTFTMNAEWAKLASTADTADQFAVDFQRALQAALYPDHVKQTAFDDMVKHYGVAEDLELLKKSFPLDLLALSVPKDFPDLPLEKLIANVGLIGDRRLGSQLQYLCSAYSMLQQASKLLVLRNAGDAVLGQAGGSAVLTEEAVQLFDATRGAVQAFTAVGVAAGKAETFAEQKEIGHLSALDAFVHCPDFTPFAKGVVEDEVKMWVAAWTSLVKSLVDTVNSAIPEGWQVHKETLLVVENQDVVKTMLTNSKFSELSKTVGDLSVALALIRKAQAPPILEAELMTQMKTCIASGTETVSVTYAVYMMREVIPTKKDKAAEIKELRKQMAAKKVMWGASLEAEACRLSV